GRAAFIAVGIIAGIEAGVDAHAGRAQIHAGLAKAGEIRQSIVLICCRDRDDVVEVVTGRVSGINVVIAGAVSGRGDENNSLAAGRGDRVHQGLAVTAASPTVAHYASALFAGVVNAGDGVGDETG